MNNSDSLQEKQKFHMIVMTYMQKLLFVICVYLIFGQIFQHVHAAVDTGIHTDDKIASDPYQSQHGSVWLLPENGAYIEALQTDTDVDYTVTGAIAQATVRQQFINNNKFWAEGIYIFPLPVNAAVDKFRMFIGDRIIEGQIQKREQARKTYQKARSEGKKASLIEQQRPNIFTTSLANIAPGEKITIEFEYQQILDYNDDYFRLRFPMVVGPRYIKQSYHTEESVHQTTPGHGYHDNSDETSVYTETDQLNSNHNPTRIHLLLDAGVSLKELKSTFHSIDIRQTSENRYSIATIGKNIKADRDFELVWKPELHNDPQLTAFTETTYEDGESDSYTMLTILPPEMDYLQQKLQARDVIFVLDISGSMSGTSIEQAKASLLIALEGLSPVDRFNIILFNDRAERLFPDAVVATENYKQYASNFIDKLQASGGTEMLDALKLAFSDQLPFSRFRQVVFLTDGNISNEAELFTVINNQLGDNRLFTIGIGSAPNAYFMSKAANMGRGTFTYIGDINEVQEKTVSLFKKLETPALVNIELGINQPGIDSDEYEVFPATIPDLYAGETTTVLIKGKQKPKNLTITGDYGNIEWQRSTDPSHSNASQDELTDVSLNTIKTAWARAKITSLMNQHHEANEENERETIIQDITDTALKHKLVSRYTSLVAVDVTPSNDSGSLLQQRLKNNLPHGWKNQTTSHGIMLAQTATNSKLSLLLAVAFFMAAVLFTTAYIYAVRDKQQRSRQYLFSQF